MNNGSNQGLWKSFVLGYTNAGGAALCDVIALGLAKIVSCGMQTAVVVVTLRYLGVL